MSHVADSPDGFPDGPRDWSPRLEWSIRMIERIRKVIPKELLIEEGFVKIEDFLGNYQNGKAYAAYPSRIVGNIYSVSINRNGVFVPERQKVMFLVKLGNTVEEVCLTDLGAISMGIMVTQLLDGLIKGYEHLGELNPFRTTEAGGPA